MDVRIGITESPQVIEVALPDDADRDAVRAQVTAVLSGDEPILVLEDKRGKEISIPGARISFVEVGAASETRQIGFGA